MLDMLTSRAWWLAAGQRAARTVVVVLLGVLRPLIEAPADTWRPAVSTVALAVVLSLATSLASLPETDGTAVPWWRATLNRAARTAGQTLVAGIGSSVLWSDVAWAPLWQTVAIATIGTIGLAILSALPETIPLARIGADGTPDVNTLPDPDGPQHRA